MRAGSPGGRNLEGTPESKECVMTDKNATETRRYHFEQIRARELARGASADEATRVATATVDTVMENAAAAKPTG